MAAKRRIKKAVVQFLSLCPRGMNGIRTLLKADKTTDTTHEEDVSVDLLTKFDESKGELTFVAYVPEMPDKEGDVASAEIVKEMAYDAAMRGLHLDIRHDFKAIPRDKAFIAQSFIVQKGDPRFQDMTTYDGKKVDVTGAWGGIIKLEDPELKAKYAKEGWAGVSMGGAALYETIRKEGDLDMTSAELTAALEASNKALITGIGTAFTAVLKEAGLVKDPMKKEETAKPLFKAMPFRGDVTDALAVEMHSLTEGLRKSCAEMDHSDPEAVQNSLEAQKVLRDRIKEIKKEQDEAKAAGGDKDAVNRQIAGLEKQIADLKKASGQPGANENGGGGPIVVEGVTLNKEDAAAAEALLGDLGQKLVDKK